MKSEPRRTYDLEERLLDYGAEIISLTRSLSHHGEAQAAESPADFIHKLRLALKELRESQRWLKLIDRAGLLPKSHSLVRLLDETDQLVRIFVSSIATAEKRRQK